MSLIKKKKNFLGAFSNQELLKILIITLLLFFILLLGYGLRLEIINITLIFFFSLVIILLFLKKMGKDEIEYNFTLWENQSFLEKINLAKLLGIKTFPSWLFFSFFLSLLSLFKIPIILIGKIEYKGRNNPLKEITDKNSEIKIIKKHFFLIHLILIILSFSLLLIAPLYAAVPLLVSISLLIPIPGNQGYELFVLGPDYWLGAVKLNLIALLFYLFYISSLFVLNFR